MSKMNINKVNSKLIREGQNNLISYNISVYKDKTIDKYLEIDNFYL